MKKLFISSLLFMITSCYHKQCRLYVTLESGEKIKCKYIQSYVSGVSNIKTCSGNDIQTNTNNIKSVTEIN